MNWRAFAYLACVSLSIGCSASFTVNTNPSGTTLWSGKKKLGETPLEFSTGDLEEPTSAGHFVRLEKEGYKRVWLWLPDSAFHRTLNINLNPFYVRTSLTESSLVHQISPEKLNLLTDKLLGLQANLMLGKAIEDKEITDILKSNPYLASAHFIAGLSAAAKKDRKAAVDFLRDAVRYNQEQTDFQILLNEYSGPETTQ